MEVGKKVEDSKHGRGGLLKVLFGKKNEKKGVASPHDHAPECAENVSQLGGQHKVTEPRRGADMAPGEQPVGNGDVEKGVEYVKKKQNGVRKVSIGPMNTVEGTGHATTPYQMVEHLHANPEQQAVLFDDGSSYSGEWRNGIINGRGVFLWSNGDRFEGEWKDGKQHGQGTFASADGSVYYGGWKDGRKDGDGVYKPTRNLQGPSMLYLRKYDCGVMLQEIPLKVEDRKDIRYHIKSEIRRSIARPLRPGEVIYKGHHSYDLMRQLQLGIMYSIAQAKPGDAPLKKEDFKGFLVQNFPVGGDLPAFKYKEYAPRVFQRLRHLFGVDDADFLVSLTGGPALREMPSPGSSGCIFFLSEDDRFLIKSVRKEEMGMLLNLIRKYETYIEKNPASLIVRFYGIHRVRPWLGRNARFLVMGNVLPTEKRMHRRYDLKGSTYGRTVGKGRLSDPSVTLKDLDVDMTIELSVDRYKNLIEKIEEDVEFLSSMNVIDYSLLLGVHFISWGDDEWYAPFSAWHTSSSRSLWSRGPTRQSSLALGRQLVKQMEGMITEDEKNDYIKNAADVIASANSVRDAARSSAASASSQVALSSRAPSRAMTSFNISRENLNRESEDEGLNPMETAIEAHERWKRHGVPSDQDIGWATPAVAVQVSDEGKVVRQPVLLYFGIIDFIQKYNTRKRLERVVKTTLHGSSVSVADPKRYARRFLGFMKKIFVQERRP